MEFNLENFKAMYRQVDDLVAALNDIRLDVTRLRIAAEQRERAIASFFDSVKQSSIGTPEDLERLKEKIDSHFGLKKETL